MTLFESLAGTRCMNRWDEGSWDRDPIRHGRFTIIVKQRNYSLYRANQRMLYKLYLHLAIQYKIQ